MSLCELHRPRTVLPEPCRPQKAITSDRGVVAPPFQSSRPLDEPFQVEFSCSAAELANAGELVGVEARPTHQRTVDIGLGDQLGDGARLHTAAVLNT